MRDGIAMTELGRWIDGLAGWDYGTAENRALEGGASELVYYIMPRQPARIAFYTRPSFSL